MEGAVVDHSRTIGIVGILLAGSLLAKPGATTSSSAQQAPGDSQCRDRIVFTATHNDNSDIHVSDMNGEAVQRVTDHPAYDGWPAWSPSGDRIAFTTNRDGHEEIYVMDADGSGLQRLTNTPGRARRPSWSPGAEMIAYEAVINGAREIHAINADGTDSRRLTYMAGDKMHPSWSPCGRYILFDWRNGDEMSIGIMNADGSEPRVLDGGRNASSATYSQDGGTLVLNREVDGIIEVFVMDADGGNTRRLTYRQNHDEFPRWCCGGSTIVYDAHVADRHEIRTIDRDGSNMRVVLDVGSSAATPSCSGGWTAR